MTETQIKRICSSLGVVENEFIQVPLLRTILMETNQGIEYHQDFIKVNTHENFIEIKQYHPIIKSGLISPNVVIDNDDNDNPKCSTLKVSMPNAPIWRHDKYFSFRNSHAGDKLLRLSATGATLESHKIIAVNFRKIYLDSIINPLDSGESYIYLDGETTTAKQDLLDPKLFFEYKPMSNNYADIYIQFDAITGFELVSEKVGNGGI